MGSFISSSSIFFLLVFCSQCTLTYTRDFVAKLFANLFCYFVFCLGYVIIFFKFSSFRLKDIHLHAQHSFAHVVVVIVTFNILCYFSCYYSSPLLWLLSVVFVFVLLLKTSQMQIVAVTREKITKQKTNRTRTTS